VIACIYGIVSGVIDYSSQDMYRLVNSFDALSDKSDKSTVTTQRHKLTDPVSAVRRSQRNLRSKATSRPTEVSRETSEARLPVSF